MISTRVYPIVSQNIIDEITDSLNLTELSTFKKFLVDTPLDSDVSKQVFIKNYFYIVFVVFIVF